jgi:hypothetical protein
MLDSQRSADGITANHAKYAKREVEQTFMAADADLVDDYANKGRQLSLLSFRISRGSRLKFFLRACKAALPKSNCTA